MGRGETFPLPALTQTLQTALTTSNARGGALDALRFAAAFLIVVYHYLAQAPLPLDAWPEAVRRGYLATDFFLMLSGYVLARAYGPKLAQGRMSWGGFMLRRVKRIWPAHLVVLGGFVLVLAAAAAMGVSPQVPAQFRWQALLAQALLVQSWGMLPDLPGWNTVTWSLSALLVCYAAFPWLWRLQARLAPWSAFALAAAALVSGDLVAHGLFGRPLYDLPTREALLRALPLFGLGISLARLTAERPLSHVAAVAAGPGALALLILAQAFGRFDLLSIACIALIILAAGSRPVMRPWPFAAFGARVSFSLFLTHLLVATVWYGGAHALEARIPLPPAAQWAVWWAGFPLALLAALAFDRLADQPLQRWLNRPRTTRRRAAPKALAAAGPP